MRAMIAVCVLLIQCMIPTTGSGQSWLQGVVENATPGSRIHMISGVDGQPLPFPEGVAPNLKDPYQVLRYHGARFGIQHPEQQLKIIKTDMFHVPPAERNKEPILEILQKYIPKGFKGKALEIASGAGPHVVHFAQYYSNITWQPTEYDQKSLGRYSICFIHQ